MQHRATEGLMWYSSENCYFNELENGPNTTLDHPSRKLSRQIRKFTPRLENIRILLTVTTSVMASGSQDT